VREMESLHLTQMETPFSQIAKAYNH
jgi:hypothetical protein